MQRSQEVAILFFVFPDYNPKHTGLLELRLEPNYLTDEVLAEMMEFVLKYKNKVKKNQIYRKLKWA